MSGDITVAVSYVPCNTGLVERKQLINKRMTKSQQMRWSHTGVHLLLQVRAEVVDRRLAKKFQRWYPGFQHSSEFAAAA